MNPFGKASCVWARSHECSCEEPLASRWAITLFRENSVTASAQRFDGGGTLVRLAAAECLVDALVREHVGALVADVA